jgi:hypothetical protein
MFGLETIIALNEKASEMERTGEPVRNAFSEVGVNLSKREKKKDERLPCPKEDES